MRHIKKGKRKDNKTIMCSTTQTEMNKLLVAHGSFITFKNQIIYG